MSLISESETGWFLNHINSGPPYVVQEVGPSRYFQVADGRGTCAVTGPNGAVFCATKALAEYVCALANNGRIEVLP